MVTAQPLFSPGCGSSYLNRAVVIAMALMHMVEMTRYEVIRMIAVGNSVMPAARAMLVGRYVTAAGVSSIASLRVPGIHFQLVFVHMIAVHIVHVAVVKETLVSLVHDGGVAAVSSMLMRMSLVSFVTHGLILLCRAMPDVWRGSQKGGGETVSYDPVWTLSRVGHILHAYDAFRA
jgi:hypothetical protein